MIPTTYYIQQDKFIHGYYYKKQEDQGMFKQTTWVKKIEQGMGFESSEVASKFIADNLSHMPCRVREHVDYMVGFWG